MLNACLKLHKLFMSRVTFKYIVCVLYKEILDLNKGTCMPFTFKILLFVIINQLMKCNFNY